MKCEKCGMELKENASFCEECGTPVVKKDEDIVLESEEEAKAEEPAEEKSEEPEEAAAPEAEEAVEAQPEETAEETAEEAEPVAEPEAAVEAAPEAATAPEAAPVAPAPEAPKAQPAPAKKAAAPKADANKNSSMIFIIAIAAVVVFLILIVVGFFVVKKIRYNMKVNAATAKLQEGEYADALTGYLEAVDINDDRAEAYIGQGNTYLAMGDYNEAISEYEIAQSKDKKNTEIADLRYEALKLKYKNENQIDLNRYVSVYFNGYDTVGKANVDFDYKDMISYNRVYFDAKASIGADAREDIVSVTEKELRNLFKEVNYTLSQTDGLKNGDEVQLTWEIPAKLKNLQDQALFTIKAESKSFTVSGLKDIKVVDPFENLEVTFRGNSGNGKVRVTQGEQYIKYTVDKSEGLKNGDKIKVSVTNSDGSEFSPEKLVKSRGVKLTSTEKEYTVEGLSIYVNSIEEIGKDTLAKIDKQAVDVALSYTSNKDKTDLNSYKVIGHYLAVSKTGDRNPVNRLYCLVSYTVTDTENGPVDIIYGVSFKDLMVLNNEVVVNLDSSNSHADSISLKPKSGWSFSVPGYTDVGSFVADNLAKIAKDYDYTTDIRAGQ
ncbi:MAG: zinc-ribbon domain-containing protein [Clostridiales bacterium]|nr:zinc-ribbon domain-containing protein [Clostridiales bacterium]